MKIKRNGVEFELSIQEMNEAYNEIKTQRTTDEIRYAVQDITLERYGTDEPSDEILDSIGMTYDDLIADIYDEYVIHCDNYDAFGIGAPEIKPFVEELLYDYGYFELEE